MLNCDTQGHCSMLKIIFNVSDNNWKVSDKNLNVIGNDLNVSDNNLNVSENNLNVSENDLNISENNLTASENSFHLWEHVLLFFICLITLFSKIYQIFAGSIKILLWDFMKI